MNRERPIGFVRALATGGLGAVVLITACAEKHVAVWTPSPQVAWKDITAESIQSLDNEYRILVPEPTKGLFPSSIAVMRVSARPTGTHTTAGRLFLLRDPPNEFLQWNSAFDDQMAVSEVFPLAQRDLAGADATPEHLMAVNRALHAGIGLVYSFNARSENESEMIGLLYSTAEGTPIAAFHAQASSIVVPEEEHDERSVDLWKTDSDPLVRAKFQQIVYDCLRHLIMHDVPAEVASPDGWTPVGPIMPVEWPPRFHRSGG